MYEKPSMHKLELLDICVILFILCIQCTASYKIYEKIYLYNMALSLNKEIKMPILLILASNFYDLNKKIMILL